MYKKSPLNFFFRKRVLPLLLSIVFVPQLWSASYKTPEFKLKIINIGKSAYVSVNDLVSALGLDSAFDVTYQKGKIYKRRHYAVYKIGYSTILVDNLLYRSNRVVRRWKGGVYIPVDAAFVLCRHFYGAMKFTRGKSYIRGVAVIVPKGDNSGRRTSPTIHKKDRIGFIIIDAGHGGKDPGALGKGGLKEKHIALKLALKVERILKKKMPHIKVKLTRRTDRFIELARRTEIANRELRKNYNGIFVSIHINASIVNRISGFETYFLSQNPTNEAARKTAALENNVIILEKKKGRKKFGDVELVEALMMTTQIQKESAVLAQCVQHSLKGEVRRSKSRGVHKADFFVLRGSLMPAILVECGFITNKKEARQLNSSSYQNKLAKGISQGVCDFIKKYNKTIK